jgi:hypothetical protein
MPNRISDELWSQLDPKAGRLSPPARVRAAVAGALVLVLGVVTAAGWYSGRVWPQLSISHHNAHGSADGDVVVSLTITNDGWFPVDVAAPRPDPGPTAPGLDLLRVEGPLPTGIAPRASIELTYVYRITDCAAVPRTIWRPSVDVARPWGTLRVSLSVGSYETSWPQLTWAHCPLR